jgi:2,4-dienoyl-CoA reductase-like NADH-dependent reductase (Old Yellow Enzyme family)
MIAVPIDLSEEGIPMSLFSPLTIRDITFRNRIAVSPMCQYSSEDGFADDWHLVHLGSRAVGGAGLVIAEATTVSPEGRISPQDLGLWKDAHIPALARVTRFIHEQGSIAGIQLAHAGRKASTVRPWEGDYSLPEAEGGWSPILAPSPIAFDVESQVPHELSREEIGNLVVEFANATARAEEAGFKVLEIHAAHGYLLSEFLSPLANQRSDEYGGSFENRTRFLRDVVVAVRKVWAERYPLFVRISATDWVEGGWTLADSVALARQLKDLGVDLIDCSSGGVVPNAKITVGPGYQVPFAEAIKREAGILTGAVGFITEAEQADEVIRRGQSDVVLLGRQLLKDPYWPLHAAHELGIDLPWPNQYERAKPKIRSTVN